MDVIGDVFKRKKSLFLVTFLFAPHNTKISNQTRQNLEIISELSDYISDGYNAQK
jgi:hypothetical protein